MANKVWDKVYDVIEVVYDYSVHGGAVGTIKLADLPDNFLVTQCFAEVETALVGGGTFIVGEDGGGDADGYFTDLDAATVGALKATGALVVNTGVFLAHLVAPAKDGVLVTIGTSPYTAGKIKFYFLGIQL